MHRNVPQQQRMQRKDQEVTRNNTKRDSEVAEKGTGLCENVKKNMPSSTRSKHQVLFSRGSWVTCFVCAWTGDRMRANQYNILAHQVESSIEVENPEFGSQIVSFSNESHWRCSWRMIPFRLPLSQPCPSSETWFRWRASSVNHVKPSI